MNFLEAFWVAADGTEVLMRRACGEFGWGRGLPAHRLSGVLSSLARRLAGCAARSPRGVWKSVSANQGLG